MQAPWDLGYLHWNQIPVSWQGIIDRLEPGQVTNITFATEKGKIVDVLRKRKADELYDTMLARMTAKSKIVFPKQVDGGDHSLRPRTGDR